MYWKIMKMLVLISLALILSATQLQAKIIYVVLGEFGDGTSWNSPLGSIQTAINSSDFGDEIWVAAKSLQGDPLHYPGGISVDGFYAQKQVSIRGGFIIGDDDPSDRILPANCTRISGGGQYGHAISLTCLDGTLIYDGLRITGGSATCGGGIYMVGTGLNVTIEKNVIEYNSITGSGAGIYGEDCWATIQNNDISRNSINIPAEGGPSNSGGVAIFICGGEPKILNNTIINNSMLVDPLAPMPINGYHSGAISCIGSDSEPFIRPTIIGNIISGTTSGNAGNGIYCLLTTDTHIERNTIIGNTGKGIEITGWPWGDITPSLSLASNIIAENSGIGIHLIDFASNPSYPLSALMIGNTIVDSGGLYNVFIDGTNYATILFANNIVAFGSTGIYSNWGLSTISLDSNTFYNTTDYISVTPGQYDYHADPLFLNVGQHDYHLSMESPCINTGNNNLIYNFNYDIDGDLRSCLGTVDRGADEVMAAGIVAAVQFSPQGGFYQQPVLVSRYCATPDAVVRYTLDGTDPTSSSTIWPAGANLRISVTKTLKARAWKSGWVTSPMTSATYTIGWPDPNPPRD